MKYAFFGDGGAPVSFHNDMRLQEAPDGAVELTEAQWIRRLDLRLVGGAVVIAPTEAPLADQKANLLQRLNRDFEGYLMQFQSSYPATERLTWDIQRTEAAAWIAWDAGGSIGAEPATPMLDAIAAGRGLDREELIQRAHEKATLFSQVCAAAIGERQRVEQLIDDATNKQELPDLPDNWGA